jgi:hypothetical protein
MHRQSLLLKTIIPTQILMNLETVNPRDTWEQEQLHEYEGLAVLQYHQLLRDQINFSLLQMSKPLSHD